MILPASHVPGRNMTLTKFCKQYQLHPKTEWKFAEQRYEHAHMLQFVTQEDLTAMGFLQGGDCIHSRCCGVLVSSPGGGCSLTIVHM